MVPNSKCWKEEETKNIGECIHCSDYEKVNNKRLLHAFSTGINVLRWVTTVSSHFQYLHFIS